jgi:hypothetical protein
MSMFTIISCELLGVYISQRLTEFVEDLNRDTDRDLHDNFHQEMIDVDNNLTSELGFAATPLRIGYRPFAVMMTGSDDDYKSGIQSWDGTINSDNYVGRTIRFYFKKQEFDWYILAIRMEWDDGGPQHCEWGDYAGI